MSEKTKNNEVSFAQRLSRKRMTGRRTLGITALLALVASCTFWGATDDIDRGDEPPEGKPATTPAIIRGDEKLSDLQALQQILKVSDDQAVELKAFIRQEQAITHRPLYAGNRVELLKDGPETYDAMLSAIGDATDEVHMETFIFADDKVGQIFSEALIDAQRRGVQVRLIYDGLANLDTKEDFFDALETAETGCGVSGAATYDSAWRGK
jgi:phosphatidylserine/phosphatidylglycerophosphate/cardiolipin synthase-like enzyme